MYLEIQRIDPEEIRHEVLKSRAQKAHTRRSIEFVAVDKGVEVGLLSFEDRSEDGLGFVYEIFVPREFRCRGVGSFLLLHAEEFALQLSCTILRLKPYALDVDPGLSVIKAWYSRCGYRQSIGDIEHMEKSLNKIAQ